jgi:hypothetical protein
MNGQWCVFNQKFSKEYCEYIVAEANKIPKQTAKIGISGDDIKYYVKNFYIIIFLSILVWLLLGTYLWYRYGPIMYIDMLITDLMC